MATIVTEVGDFEKGTLTLVSTDDELTVSAHWPFDRDTDEWIDVRSRIGVAAMQTCWKGLPFLVTEDNEAFGMNETAKPNTLAIMVRGRNSVGPVEVQIVLRGKDAENVREHIEAVCTPEQPPARTVEESD